jgi:hypothetical protein
MSDRISRGEIISLLAGLPLAVAATTAVASAADDSSGTKAQFKYVDKSTMAGKKCSGCTLFKAPGACLVVKGKISPNGYCTAYAPKSHM